jgi:hypothetical protein
VLHRHNEDWLFLAPTLRTLLIAAALLVAVMVLLEQVT